MSKRTRAFGPAASNRRKSSRKALPQYFLGSVAVVGLVLGCAWTVYTNVFGANVYPSVSSAAFEAPAEGAPRTRFTSDGLPTRTRAVAGADASLSFSATML